MCGVDANNQIPKVLLLSLPVKKIKIGEYLAKGQARRWLSRAPCAPGLLASTLPETKKVRETSLTDSTTNLS